jgi:anti-sigma factor RsiW
MNLENHERAKKLLAIRRVEGIAAAEEEWLEDHLTHCDACSDAAQALAVAIDAVRSFSVMAQPDAVRRVSAAVRLRAEQMRQERERAIPIWIAAAMSTALAILTTPYTWAAFAWLGRLLQVPDVTWQVGFLMWWFLPATVVGAVAARRRTISNRKSL